MGVRERRARIVEIVQERQSASVEFLAARLDSSRETIRRDLTALSEQGLLLKIHGGARIPRADVEGPLRARLSRNVEQKRRIAVAAAALFESGDSMFIDTGSTTFYFAEALARKSGLTAITNSASIARALTNGGGHGSVFLLGGGYRNGNQQTVGTLAVRQVECFRPRYAVITIGAMNAEAGIMDFDVEEAQMARAMIRQAAKLVVLADSSKFHQSALAAVCPLSAVDRLVTDSPPDGRLRGALEKAGVAIHTADRNG